MQQEEERTSSAVPEERRVHLRRVEDLQLLQYRTHTSEVAIKEIQTTLAAIERALVALVAYEGRLQTLGVQVHALTTYQDLLKNLHIQQNKWTSDVQDKVRSIELQMPLLLAVKTWVIKAALGVLGLVGAAVVALVLRG